jgi:hypothetical protein
MKLTGDRIRSVWPCRIEARAVISIARTQSSVCMTAFLRPLVRRCFNPKLCFSLDIARSAADLRR